MKFNPSYVLFDTHKKIEIYKILQNRFCKIKSFVYALLFEFGPKIKYKLYFDSLKLKPIFYNTVYLFLLSIRVNVLFTFL